MILARLLFLIPLVALLIVIGLVDLVLFPLLLVPVAIREARRR